MQRNRAKAAQPVRRDLTGSQVRLRQSKKTQSEETYPVRGDNQSKERRNPAVRRDLASPRRQPVQERHNQAVRRDLAYRAAKASTATWASMHRNNNAAQEARQCKEKTKDQRHKNKTRTRTNTKTNQPKPSTQPRPRPNSRPGPRKGTTSRPRQRWQ